MSTRLLLFLGLGIVAVAQPSLMQQTPGFPMYKGAAPDPWVGLPSHEAPGWQSGHGQLLDSQEPVDEEGPVVVAAKPSVSAGVSVDQLRHPLTDKARRLLQKALALLAAHDFAHAREELRKAVKDRSAAPYAHSLLGQEYIRGGQFKDAVPELQQALESFPSNVPDRANLGYALFMIRQNDSADKELRRALELQPANPRTHLVLGMICYVAARDEEAEEHLKFAAKELPGAHLVLARFYRLTQRPDASDREFQTYVQMTGLTDSSAVRAWLVSNNSAIAQR